MTINNPRELYDVLSKISKSAQGLGYIWRKDGFIAYNSIREHYTILDTQ